MKMTTTLTVKIEEVHGGGTIFTEVHVKDHGDNPYFYVRSARESIEQVDMIVLDMVRDRFPEAKNTLAPPASRKGLT